MIFVSILFAIENALFHELPKNIAVQNGKEISAWDGRNSIELFGTTSAVSMVPAGDGSYEIRVDLFPGQDYNYIFFAYTTSSVSGLKVNTTYYDAVPVNGSDGIVISLSSITISDISSSTKGYISIGGDARRYVVIPDVASGTTFFIFNNFAGKPLPPKKIAARPGSRSVILRWSEPSTYWGGISSGESFRPVDVITGGYIVFRSTDGVNYSSVIYISGSSSVTYKSNLGLIYEYLDTGLDNNTTYYYVVVSSDAYTQLNLVSNYSNSVIAKTGNEVQFIFRVEGYDYKDHEYIWLTDPYSGTRIPGRFIRVYLKDDG